MRRPARPSTRRTVQHRLRRLLAGGVVAAATLVTAACVHTFWDMEAREVARPAAGGAPTRVKSPLKVHLLDGSTVIFGDSSLVSSDRIAGHGMHYPLLSDSGRARESVPMDSVVGVEVFDPRVLKGTSIAVSLAATAALAGIGAIVALAVFGSCPTIYADAGAGLALQAEGFSYSIAPIMEHRDVDGLRVRPGPDGRLRLELRNEALETHFINHIEVLAARSAPGTRVLPDQRNVPVAVAGFARRVRATDRAGRDVSGVLRTADGDSYATDARVLAAAKAGDLDDWIDLDVSDLPPGDSVAVVLRMRNSLLNTVLLYEGLLGGRDAMDWLAHDLEQISTTLELARWYVTHMGMRASVGGDGHGESAHLGDIGPIAFRDVALVLPREAAGSGRTRVRLRFIADNWRIDELRVAGTISRPAYELLAVDSVVVPVPAAGGAPVHDDAAVAALAQSDERYLETRPGQRLSLVFATPSARGSSAQDDVTYLIAWQGWYREWIRGAWLEAPSRTTPFVAGEAAVQEALVRWRGKKDAFERDFYASKIPVR